MDLIKSVITGRLFNQRIGGCLQVLLITWLLWRPIHCNSNRVNQGNRRTKSTEQQLNQNDFDPFHRPYPTQNRSETLYSDQYNLNYNYLLSVLQNDERQAILNNVIHQKSAPTQASDGEIHENVVSVVPDNDIELSAEDRASIHETNKLLSPSLNVIDVSPQETQLAHSVLLIHKPKPNKNTVNPTVKPTVSPQLLYPQTIIGIGIKGPISPFVTDMKLPTITTTTNNDGYAIPVGIRNNHRPLFLRPFPGKRTTTTPATTVSIKSTTTSTTISSSSATNTVTDSQTVNTTTTTSEESDDMPIIISSNHKYKHSFPMFTRQKLTSTEYALVFTTPQSVTESDKSVFTEVPTLSTVASTPVYTIRPPYMTTLSHQKRPPMKIMTVNANRVRQPEEIYHEGITVLDPPFSSGHPHKLPPNTTILHKNLIVPMKDGRPKPVYPMTSTTQFPVYPILAGITKWHTSPTTPWPVPVVTTTSPEQMMTMNTVNNQDTTTTMATSDNPVAAQSVNRPILVSGHPMMSTPTQQTSQVVTVTPIRSTSHSPTASTFLVTHSSPRPSTSTAGYVNAIWAPPMPVQSSRPVQEIVSSSPSSWYSPISNIFSYAPAASSMFNFMGMLRMIVFSFLVFFVPPFTLAAALMQAAVG